MAKFQTEFGSPTKLSPRKHLSRDAEEFAQLDVGSIGEFDDLDEDEEDRFSHGIGETKQPEKNQEEHL